MRTLIAALLLAWCGIALSQAIPKNDPANTRNAHQVRADNQRGARDNPLIVEATSAESNSAKAAAEQVEKDEKAHNESLIAWGTVALAAITLGLVVVTGVLARYTYGLYKETKTLREGADDVSKQQALDMAVSIQEAARAASAMQELAQAAFQQGDINRKQFISANRPKLILRDATSEQDMHNFIKIDYVLANVGSTVAHVKAAALDVRVFKGWEFGPDNLPEIASQIDDSSNGIKPFELQPGEQVALSFTSKTLRWNVDNGTCHTFLEPEYGLFFYGQMIYRDELSIARRIGFRRKFFSEQHRFLCVDDGTHYEYQD